MSESFSAPTALSSLPERIASMGEGAEARRFTAVQLIVHRGWLTQTRRVERTRLGGGGISPKAT